MAQVSPKSVIIVGGGIVGLCIAVVAQARGHRVTIVARDRPEDTASGVAAGMIAPVLEAVNDPDPVKAYGRLKAAQMMWLDLFDRWPQSVREELAYAQWAHRHLYLSQYDSAEAASVGLRLEAMGAKFEVLDRESRVAGRFDPDHEDVIQVMDDWLVSSAHILKGLRDDFEAGHGIYLVADAVGVTRTAVSLADGRTLESQHVVVAAGYGGEAFSATVPTLSVLSPIKGELLEFEEAVEHTHNGVVRSKSGYWARHGRGAKFGASMEVGRSDLGVDVEVIARLNNSLGLMMGTMGDGFKPRVGVRAASPDGWPMIGRDPASGVLVATAMRRNGYVFAPLAARIITDLIEGVDTPGAEIYRPDRF